MVRSASRRRSPAAGCLLAALLALSSSGQARAEAPSLVVIPFTQGDNVPAGAGGRFAGQVSEELKGADSVTWVAPPATARAAAKAPGGPLGETALAEGQKQLAELKFDAAVSALKTGLEQALSQPARADFAQITEAYVSLGVAYFRMGDEDKAEQALLSVLRIDSNYSLPDQYPPVFARAFEKTKKRAAKGPRGKLSIDGPAGSVASLNGRELGPVPAVAQNLLHGPHHVKVTAAGGETFGQTVELKGASAAVKASFPGGPVASSDGVTEPRVLGTLDPELVARVSAYAKAAGADFALVGMVYRSADHQLTAATALYSSRAKGFAVLPPVAFDRELLTSQVEAFKLSDAVVAKVNGFGSAVKLPTTLVAALPKIAAARGADAEGEVTIESGPARIALKPEGSRRPITAVEAAVATRERSDAPKVRALERPSTLAETSVPLAPEPAPVATVDSGGGSRWYWWVIGGVALAAAAGGTAYGVTQANRPVTASGSASW